jgi:hypothetical protein
MEGATTIVYENSFSNCLQALGQRDGSLKQEYGDSKTKGMGVATRPTVRFHTQSPFDPGTTSLKAASHPISAKSSIDQIPLIDQPWRRRMRRSVKRFPAGDTAETESGEHRKSGAGDRDRTGDIQLGKLTFYH